MFLRPQAAIIRAALIVYSLMETLGSSTNLSTGDQGNDFYRSAAKHKMKQAGSQKPDPQSSDSGERWEQPKAAKTFRSSCALRGNANKPLIKFLTIIAL
jgi:hypothetical protein